MKFLIYSRCVLCKICIRGKCIWPIFERLTVCFGKIWYSRCNYRNDSKIIEHTVILHISIINACSLAMVYVSPFVVSIVLFKSRKKIRVLEKSPLFARWKNKAKLAVITSLGCIFVDRLKCILSILLMIIMWISKRNAYVGDIKTFNVLNCVNW